MEVVAMIYTIFETAKACDVKARKHLRRAALADIRNPHTPTSPEPLEEMLTD